MTLSHCPSCGSDELHCIPQVSPEISEKLSSGIDVQQMMQYVVSYALMGATTTKQLKGVRQPMILLVGTVIGGVVGCAAFYFNHHQGRNQQPIQPNTQPVYQCIECGYEFRSNSL